MRTIVFLVVCAMGTTIAAAQSAADATRGQEVFNSVCAACHSVDPPMDKAPPMRMVVKHYLEAGLADPWAAIASWISAPDSAKSALPAHAIERFGLMPPQVLPDADIASLVAYLQTLEAAEPDTLQHRGMRHRGMNQR